MKLNVDYASYDDTTFRALEGKVNSNTCFGLAAGYWKISQCNATEEYESIGDGIAKTDYHYIRVSVTYEYNPANWITEAKLVSMSTLQLLLQLGVPSYYYYDYIKISETAYAKDPWPLLSTGAAVPYDDNDPADYGYVDHGFPLTADISAIATAYSLSIP